MNVTTAQKTALVDQLSSVACRIEIEMMRASGAILLDVMKDGMNAVYSREKIRGVEALAVHSTYANVLKTKLTGALKTRCFISKGVTGIIAQSPWDIDKDEFCTVVSNKIYEVILSGHLARLVKGFITENYINLPIAVVLEKPDM